MIRQDQAAGDRWLGARTPALALLPVLCMVGCGGESGDQGWVGEIETLGDTTFVTTLAGRVWKEDPVLEEELRIGDLGGQDEYLFGEVFRIAPDLLGGVYVLDRQGPVLRHFDKTGEYLATLGREGEGPGEYTWMSLGMVVDPNGILLLSDWGNQRVNRYSIEGVPLGSWPVAEPYFSTVPVPGLFLAGPDAIWLETRIDGTPAYLRIEGGETTDTLLMPDLPGLPAERGGPYRIDRYWSMGPSGELVVGVSHEYDLQVRGPEGHVTRIRRSFDPLPVRPEEAEAWNRRFRWMEQQPNARPPEGEWIPATMPPYRGLRVGSDGRVWVHRNVESIRVEVDQNPGGPPQVPWTQPQVWDLFEPSGRYLGEVSFPRGFTPHVFGSGVIWGVQTGDLGEHYVVRMGLREPVSG